MTQERNDEVQSLQIIFANEFEQFSNSNITIRFEQFELHLELPEHYPHVIPQYKIILTSSKQIVQTPHIHATMLEMFTSGSPIIYQWVEYLKENLLQQEQEEEASNALPCIPSSQMGAPKRAITTDRTLFLMLGGTLYDESCKQKRLLKRMNVKKATLRDKQTIEKDTKRWTRDYNYICKRFCAQSKHLHCYDCVYPVMSCYKKQNMELLARYFAEPAQHYLIYWSGHGEPDTGDWCFSASKAEFTAQDKITLEELLSLWINGLGFFHQKPLTIISDSCHSGYWIERIKAIPNNLTKFGTITIQAGCQPEEESWVDSLAEVCPSSLLLRKMLYHMDEKANSGTPYVWPYSRQHPLFYCNNPDTLMAHHISALQDEQYAMLKIAKDCKLRLCQIDKEWKVSQDGKTATLGDVVLKGNFEKDFDV